MKQEALLFLFLWSAVISRMLLVPDVFERKLMETPMSMNEKRYRVCFQDCDSAVPPFKVVDLERGIEYQEREIPPEFHRLPANYINSICDFVGEKGVNFFKYVFAYGWAPFKKPELRLFKGKKKWVQKPELALRRMNEPPEPKNDKRYLVCFRDASASPVFRIVDLEKDIEYAEGEMPPEFHRMPAHCINDCCEIIGRGLSNCFKYVFAYGWDPYKKPELRLFKGKKKWVKKPVLALRPVARDDVPWPLRKRKDYLSTHYYDDPNHLYDDDFWVGRV